MRVSNPDFFQTMMGRKFYEGDFPKLVKAMEKIGNELERANDLKEKEMQRQLGKDLEKYE
jgi:hypothetical protein